MALSRKTGLQGLSSCWLASPADTDSPSNTGTLISHVTHSIFGIVEMFTRWCLREKSVMDWDADGAALSWCCLSRVA